MSIIRTFILFFCMAFSPVVHGHKGCGCGGGHGAAHPKVYVVTTFTVLADLVHQIGGSRVKVDTLIGPDGDPHVYELTPQDIQRALKADMFVMNGLGFENGIERLLPLLKNQPIVTASARVDPIRHTANGISTPDPHAFQSIPNFILYGEEILAALTQMDSKGGPTYKKNWEALRTKLQHHHMIFSQRAKKLPADSKKIITTHDAFGYIARDYGFHFLTPLGTSTEEEVAAKKLVYIIEEAKRRNIKVVFVEGTANPRIMEQVAQESNAKLGPKIYADGLTTAKDGPATVEAMIVHNLTTFHEAAEAHHAQPFVLHN